jgi:hypothetical protein
LLRAQLVELAKVRQGARHVARSAATVAYVVRQPEDTRHQDLLLYDLGQATANIMLAATDLGIGSSHGAVSDHEQARRVLRFPDGYFCAYLIGLGYPADRRLRPLVRPDRRPFDEVVHWDGGRRCIAVSGVVKMSTHDNSMTADICGPARLVSDDSRFHKPTPQRDVVVALIQPPF